MLFSTQLKTNAQPILNAISQHPFVTGIAAGQLPAAALTFYVEQDFNYLNAFIKVYAGAIQKSTDRATMALFANQIDFILNSEIHPHHNFCNVAGVEYEHLQHAEQAPMTYLYNEHMYNAMRTDDLIDIVAAMLPCPWTYHVIGQQLVPAGCNRPDNPFTPWINFYANLSTTEQSSTNLDDHLFTLIDEQAELYQNNRLNIVEQRFLRSCELEWKFWEQAYRQSNWRFNSH